MSIHPALIKATRTVATGVIGVAAYDVLRKALRELTPSMRRALRPEGQDQL